MWHFTLPNCVDANSSTDTPEVPRCKYCQSEDIVLDGQGVWNYDKQEWEFEEANWDPNAYCKDCSEQTRIEWIHV